MRLQRLGRSGTGGDQTLVGPEPDHCSAGVGDHGRRLAGNPSTSRTSAAATPPSPSTPDGGTAWPQSGDRHPPADKRCLTRSVSAEEGIWSVSFMMAVPMR